MSWNYILCTVIISLVLIHCNLCIHSEFATTCTYTIYATLHQCTYTEVMSAPTHEASTAPVSDIHSHFIIYILSRFQHTDTDVHDDAETPQHYWSTYCFACTMEGRIDTLFWLWVRDASYYRNAWPHKDMSMNIFLRRRLRLYTQTCVLAYGHAFMHTCSCRCTGNQRHTTFVLQSFSLRCLRVYTLPFVHGIGCHDLYLIVLFKTFVRSIW